MDLFTYGTLMVPEIMRHVAGCDLQGVAVTVEGYVRYGVRGEQYPGVIGSADERVEGILYRDVPTEAMRRLDLFEGEMYHRETVRVVRKSDGVAMAAEVYVFKPAYAHLLTGDPWDFQRFLKNGRKFFEDGYRGFQQLDDQKAPGCREG